MTAEDGPQVSYKLNLNFQDKKSLNQDAQSSFRQYRFWAMKISIEVCSFSSSGYDFTLDCSKAWQINSAPSSCGKR